MATLSVHPGAHLPAAVMICKSDIVADVGAAAKNALASLEHIRRINPFPVGPGEPPAPSVVNADGVRKGVVKLGWSWENRFVLSFVGAKQLERRLAEMMVVQGCTASHCIVQEWVDFDFEMRFYLLPPADWASRPGARVEPTRIECNEWGQRDETRPAGESHASFRKLDEGMLLERWEHDEEAWVHAKEQAVELSQLLLAWLRAANGRPVPMIRMDFMLKRLGPGRARVVFGEYCEMGACCLGWKTGPPTIWQAALSAALR